MAKAETKTTAPEVEEQSQTLAAKILAAKLRIGKISKDGSAVVDSKSGKKIQYATLPQVLGAITPVLAELGLDYVVAPVWSETAVSLISQNIRMFSIRFVDVKSGEVSEPIIYPFRLANNYEAIKADGSTITYATRYLLGLALGLQTEEDPDARFDNGGKKQSQQQTQQQTQQKVRTFSECKDGFYATYNKGNLEGARKTLDFILRNWGAKPEYADEIDTMQSVDLTTKPLF